jgi:hypothetical protein
MKLPSQGYKAFISLQELRLGTAAVSIISLAVAATSKWVRDHFIGNK